MRDRRAALDWKLSSSEMSEIDALRSPDGVPALFSRACNPALGAGGPADPLAADYGVAPSAPPKPSRYDDKGQKRPKADAPAATPKAA